MANTTRVSELTVDELSVLMRDLVREAVQAALADTAPRSGKGKRPPLNIPVLDVGPWPEGLSLRREDMYGDDGR